MLRAHVPSIVHIPSPPTRYRSRAMQDAMQDATYIRWFSDLGRDDVALVGGKNASLGELYQHLKPLGVEVPDGFALTAAAFRDALTEADAWGELHTLLDGLDKSDV